MKNKLKALLSVLAVSTMLGAASACDLNFDSLLGGGSSVDSSSELLKKTYSATFVIDGVMVGVVEYTEGDASIEEPELPAREHYVGAWEEYTLDGNITVNGVYTPAEYTATFVADGETVDTVAYTIVNNQIEVPAVPEKAHYVGVWQEYQLDGGDKTIVAVYTPIDYTVTFMDGDKTIASCTYNVENMAIEVPTVPEKAGYQNGAWEAYELNFADATVNAVYDIIEYTIYFVHPKTGMALCEPMTFTVETLPSLELPAVPDEFVTQMVGYTVAWDKTVADITLEDVTLKPALTAIEYKVYFVHPKTGMMLAAPIAFTIETMSDVVFPEIPEDLKMEGYTTAWDKSETDLTLEDMTVYVTVTANTYKITYDALNGTLEGDGVQEVVYGEAYELPVPTANFTFLGWYDNEGNLVESGEAWEIASDVTLTAKYDTSENFNNATTVPSYISGSRVASFSIENGALKGVSNEASATEGDVGVHVKLSFFDEIFADPSVAYFAFDLKLDPTATTTTEQIYFQDYTSGKSNWTRYETQNNCTFITAPTGAFKSYYLSRAAYQAWVNNNISNPRLLLLGGKGCVGGQYFYMDNFRPVTEAQKKQDWYSFEYGGIRVNGSSSALLYSPEVNQWHLNFNNIVASSAKYTNDIVSDGNTAFMFTKNAGDVAIQLNHSTDTWVEKELRSGGYVAYDLYVPEGSDARLGNNAELVSRLSTGWNTIYAKVPAAVKNSNGEDETSCREISRINDSTGGTYVVDNFRVITADEYYAKTLSFEAGALRDSSLNEDNKAIYYWDASDAIKSRFSMAITRDKSVTLSEAHFDTEIVKDGKQSLAFHKTNGYISFSLKPDGDMYAQLKNGFTFWVYVDLDEQPAINGTGTSNFVDGVNNKFNNGEGVVVKAREWTQITVTADGINASGRFLIIQGSTAGTYYFDGFQPLAADAE